MRPSKAFLIALLKSCSTCRTQNLISWTIVLWCKNSWSSRNTMSWRRRTQPPLAIREVDPLCVWEQPQHPIWWRGPLLGGVPPALFLPLVCLLPKWTPDPWDFSGRIPGHPHPLPPDCYMPLITWPFSRVKWTMFTGPHGELCRPGCRRPEGAALSLLCRLDALCLGRVCLS